MQSIKKFFTLLLLLTFAVSAYAADELTPEQKRARTTIFEFVKSEGFAPYIDEEDQSITFKKEGVLHWITIGSSNPFYVEFHRAGMKNGDYSRNALLRACNEANRRIRCAKAMLGESSVLFSVEMYLHSANEVRYTFYNNMDELLNCYEKVRSELAE